MNCPNNSICISKTHSILLLVIIITFATWYLHFDKYKHITEKDYNFNDKILNKVIKKLDEIHSLPPKNNLIIPNFENKISERDRNVLYDDFKPPERRYNNLRINIPTRGYPDNYQLMGLVMRDNTETAYNLFGRQKFPGSSQYEYYVTANMDRNNVKIPIKINGDKEIENGQNIQIPGTNLNNGNFTAKLYEFDTPRYIPYI